MTTKLFATIDLLFSFVQFALMQLKFLKGFFFVA